MSGLFILILICVIANCQLTKDTWMIGGTGSFSARSDNSTEPFKAKTNEISILVSGDFGKFWYDKFIAGIRLDYIADRQWIEGDTFRYTKMDHYFEMGPYVRYYFLSKENNRINIFSDLSYQYGLRYYGNTLINGHSDRLSSVLGTTIFFNDVVSVEFNIGWTFYWNKYKLNVYNTDSFISGIGFHCHLTK